MLQFGKYQLIQPLGKGGMAQVWLAHKPGIAGALKVCAIKFPRDMFTDEPAQRDALLREARVAMMLNHSNIVQVNDIGLVGELPYLELERIDGVDLAALTEQMRMFAMPWSFSLAAYILQEILEALAYAHTFSIDGKLQGIVHRDVSPHNVLASTAGEVKLMDFGIAAAHSEHSSGMHARGKLRYMAPEHLLTRAVPQSDLFAAGAIFWELLEGHKFREGRTQADLRVTVINHTVPRLTRPDVPLELARLCYALLEPDLGKRVASADEALKLLRLWPGSTSERAGLRALLARHHINRRSGMTQADVAVPPWLSAALVELNREAGITIRAEAAAAAGRGSSPDESWGTPTPMARTPSGMNAAGVPEPIASSSSDASAGLGTAPGAPVAPRNDRTSRYGDDPNARASGLDGRSMSMRDEVTATATGLTGGGKAKARPFVLWAVAFVATTAGVAVLVAWLVATLRERGQAGDDAGVTDQAAIVADATKPEAPAAPTAADTPTPTPSPAPTPAEATPTAPSVGSGAGEAGAPANAVTGADDGAAHPTAEGTTPTADTPTPPSQPTPTEPTEATPTPTTAKTPTSSKKEKPKAEVKVSVRLMFVERAQLKIGKQTVTVAPSAELRIAAGKHAVSWRLADDASWQSAGNHVFGEGLSHVVRIGKDGPSFAASSEASP